MKKVLLLFIASHFCFLGLGQFQYDTVLLKKRVIEKIGDYFEDVFEKENNEMMSFAISKIIKDSIYIPIHSHNNLFSRTSMEVLMREYGFIYKSISQGCIIPPYLEYFEETMIEASKMRYGIKFLDSIKKTSDSLDKIGLGYVKSSFVLDSLNLYKYFISNGIEDSIFTGKDNIFRVISVTISKAGELKDISYQQGHMGVMILLEEMESVLKNKFSKAMDEMPNWKPATLKGKSIKEYQEIYINGLFLEAN
jgi:hypothetical protein